VIIGGLDMVMNDRSPIHMKNHYLVARTSENNVTMDNFTAGEKTWVSDLKWFSLEDIQSCHETVYPMDLSTRLENIFSHTK